METASHKPGDTLLTRLKTEADYCRAWGYTSLTDLLLDAIKEINRGRAQSSQGGKPPVSNVPVQRGRSGPGDRKNDPSPDVSGKRN